MSFGPDMGKRELLPSFLGPGEKEKEEMKRLSALPLLSTLPKIDQAAVFTCSNTHPHRSVPVRPGVFQLLFCTIIDTAAGKGVVEGVLHGSGGWP
jgi:hypothetical protein